MFKVKNVIGREYEIGELTRWFSSGHSEFIAVYGRRRVGKTYLLHEVLKDSFTFYHTGVSPAGLSKTKMLSLQLSRFVESLRRYGGRNYGVAKNWFEAFDMLRTLIEDKRNGRRQVVFIDEMPWLDTARSMFVSAMEAFWNGWGVWQEDLMLVCCGSATSWMTDNLLNNHGGLYGRLTGRLHLAPFSLKETEVYLRSRGIAYKRMDILQCQMITGGVPYYLAQMQKGKSLPQNVDEMFFRGDSTLENEFNQLFSSLFTNADRYVSLIRCLETKKKGFTRLEIAKEMPSLNGGELTKMLAVLEENNFIIHYVPFGGNKRSTRYKLSDPFVMFVLHFFKDNKKYQSDFWEINSNSPSVNAWRGYAFENICFNHIPQIKEALGIRAVNSEVSTWSQKNNEGGAQIDMLIARADNVINLCEVKFTPVQFEITRDYDEKLQRKMQFFSQETNTKAAVLLTFITPFGVRKNQYSGSVQNEVLMDQLFT